ncbi:MAG: enoyl-CoA hydratase/isomerase family protein [Terriglobia bacterium]
MAYNTVILERANSVVTLTLNRPAKRNALTHEMMAELHAVLDEVEADSARVLIVTGAGESFCSGMDLSVLKQMAGSRPEEAQGRPSEKVLADSRRIAHLFRHFYTFSKPAIAAVNGHAVAGGCGIATLCDITLAVPEARLGYTEVRVGFMPGFVSTFLIRQIGEKRARDLLLTGRILGAEEALRLGLINEVVPREKLLERAQEIGSQLAGMSPTSLRFTKRLLAGFFEQELEREFALAIETSARIRTTRDFEEGLSAFLEKRAPHWSDE